MVVTTPWFRIALDLSHDGEWVGASYEVRQDDRLITLTVMPRPGPWDEGETLLRDVVEEVSKRYGVQLKLL